MPDWLEGLIAFLTGVGSIAGSVWAIKEVVKHETAACDARIDAYKEGLKRGEQEDHSSDS